MKYSTGNPFTDYTMNVGGYRPPRATERFFDTEADLKNDFEIWRERLRIEDAKIAAACPERPAGFHITTSSSRSSNGGGHVVFEITPDIFWIPGSPWMGAGDRPPDLVHAIATLDPDDDTTWLRIVWTMQLHHKVKGAWLENMLAVLGQMRGVSVDALKAVILAYEPKKVRVDV